MVFNPVLVASHPAKPEWYKATAKYAKFNTRIALRQLLTTLIPYFLLVTLMTYLIQQGYPYWSILPLAVLAAALALLYPATVPRGILGPAQRVGFLEGGVGRGFILPVAQDPPVALREHRLPSCPPRPAQYSSLLSTAVLR